MGVINKQYFGVTKKCLKRYWRDGNMTGLDIIGVKTAGGG